MNSILSINPSDPNPIVAQVPSVIADFWKRILAAIIDLLLVGAVGFIIGLIFFNALMRLGEWGRLLGLAISLPYFCLFNSSVGSGQTIGKRLLGVRVVNGSGELISPARAAVRDVVLSLQFLLNGISLSGSHSMQAIDTGLGLVVGVTLFAIPYLYIFNRATRQSLHDLIVGTYVIDSVTHGKVGVRPVWRGHAVVLAAFLLVGIGVSTVIGPRLERRYGLAELVSISEKLKNSQDVSRASVMKMTTWGSRGTAQTLVVKVRWRGRPENLSRATAGIASMVLQQYPDILKQQALVINVTYGFDIGIASGWRSYIDSGTLAEWKEKINQAELKPEM